MEGMLATETMQIIVQGSANFMITPDILYIDKEATTNPLKEIETLDLAFSKIPTKALYKLKINVAQEI
jgi:hypothetical protein